MHTDRRRKLERAGWTVGDAGDFLGLSADERRFVEVKLALADGLRRRREQLGLTQTELAEGRFGSSQSRVAKMEAAHRTVSTNLLLKSLFRLGASPRDVARLLSLKPPQSLSEIRETMRLLTRGADHDPSNNDKPSSAPSGAAPVRQRVERERRRMPRSPRGPEEQRPRDGRHRIPAATTIR